MSRLKAYTQIERFYRTRKFVGVIVVLFGLIVVLAGLEFRTLVLRINDYTNIILSILTLFLVITTAFYAWATYRMLAEMIESRRSEIRPVLWVELEGPKFDEASLITSNKESTERVFLDKVKIANYGRGPAINTRLKLSIPYKDGKDATPVNYIESSPIADLPANFASGSFYESEVRIYTPFYDLNKYKEEFVELTLRYEDVERNLYSMVQFYNLFSFPISQEKYHYHWVLKSEDIYLLPFSRRKSVIDEDTSVISFGEGKDKLIFRRRQPWRS